MQVKLATKTLIVAISFAVVGCSYVNESLNSTTLPLEQREKNHTLSETYTSPEPLVAEKATPKIEDRELQPATRPTESNDQVINQLHDKDGYFVGVAISGGGSRSSNFSAACMFQLQKIGLLQKVDYISSVSGGSLTAAYYCLNHEGWNPKEVQKKLTYSYATDIWFQGLLPWNTFALVFSDYDRSDLLANTLAVNLFTKDGKQQTFADLLPDRPRLLINSTDLQTGRQFIFCNKSFDEINSNLGKYPIAYAVAASSSVPVILHQVTLRDFSTSYPSYHHLLDGGVRDNLGLETLAETYRSQLDAAQKLGLPDPYPHGAVFIVLDARVMRNANVSEFSDAGIIQSVQASVGLTAAELISKADAASLDDVILKNAPENATATQIRKAIDQLNNEGYVEFKNVGGHRIRIVHFTLNKFDDIRDHLPFQGFRESINGIETYFNITEQKAFNLYQAAEVQMKSRFEEKLMPVVKEMNDQK